MNMIAYLQKLKRIITSISVALRSSFRANCNPSVAIWKQEEQNKIKMGLKLNHQATKLITGLYL